MASVLGVTSAAMRRITERMTESSSVSHRRNPSATPQRVNSDSLSSAVAVEATMRASVLTNSTVERNRFGSARRRCRMAADLLPCSARNRTRRRPTEVSAVSVPLAIAAMTKHSKRTRSSKNSWPVTRGLLEELADAPVFVNPDDRFSEQRRHRQDGERWAELFGGDGDRVGDDHVVDARILQSFDGVAGEDGVRG